MILTFISGVAVGVLVGAVAHLRITARPTKNPIQAVIDYRTTGSGQPFARADGPLDDHPVWLVHDVDLVALGSGLLVRKRPDDAEIVF